MMKLFTLKMVVYKSFSLCRVVAVSSSLLIIQDLLNSCYEYDRRYSEAFWYDKPYMMIPMHPGGVIARYILGMSTDIFYDIEELSFDDEFDCLAKEAEIKAEIVRISSEIVSEKC